MENNFLLEEIKETKKELEYYVKEISSANQLIVNDIEKLEEIIEDIVVEEDILNIPKFKGQAIFERYLEIIEKRKEKKGHIKEKKKIRGVIEKNSIIKAQKDINILKQKVFEKGDK